jgi:hypothetical protein
MLRAKLGPVNADINHIGIFRFIGATDNIRSRAEQPASYFARLKAGGIEILRHLLVEEFADDPSLLEYSAYPPCRGSFAT